MAEGDLPTFTSFVPLCHWTDAGAARARERSAYRARSDRVLILDPPPSTAGEAVPVIAYATRFVQGARPAGQELVSCRGYGNMDTIGSRQTTDRGGFPFPAKRGVGGARGRERAGPTRSHPEPGRDPAQRRRVLWGRPHGRRGRRGRSPPPVTGGGNGDDGLGSAAGQQVSVTRGGAAAARWAHNPKVGGSNPPPATICETPVLIRGPAFFVFDLAIPHHPGRRSTRGGVAALSQLAEKAELLRGLLAPGRDEISARRDGGEKRVELGCTLEQIAKTLGNVA
jgi:hypothetical protein